MPHKSQFDRSRKKNILNWRINKFHCVVKYLFPWSRHILGKSLWMPTHRRQRKQPVSHFRHHIIILVVAERCSVSHSISTKLYIFKCRQGNKCFNRIQQTEYTVYMRHKMPFVAYFFPVTFYLTQSPIQLTVWHFNGFNSVVSTADVVYFALNSSKIH